MSYSKRLALILQRADLSANKLDELAGRPKNSTSLVLSRGTDTRTRTAIAYADVLGVPVEWLIDGRGPEPDWSALAERFEAARRDPDAFRLRVQAEAASKRAA